MYARKSVIRATYTGSQLRSTVHRLFRQQCFLDQVGDQIHCIKLQGYVKGFLQLTYGTHATIVQLYVLWDHQSARCIHPKDDYV